jgi:hypothetical protein
MKTTLTLMMFALLAFASCKDKNTVPDPKAHEFSILGRWGNDLQPGIVYDFRPDSAYLFHKRLYRDSAGIVMKTLYYTSRNNSTSLLTIGYFEKYANMAIVDSAAATFEAILYNKANGELYHESERPHIKWYRIY